MHTSGLHLAMCRSASSSSLRTSWIAPLVHLDLADGPGTRHDPGLLIDLVVSDEGSTIKERLVELTRSLGGDALAHLYRQTTSHPALLGERWLRRLSRAQEELTELAARGRGVCEWRKEGEIGRRAEEEVEAGAR